MHHGSLVESVSPDSTYSPESTYSHEIMMSWMEMGGVGFIRNKNSTSLYALEHPMNQQLLRAFGTNDIM